MNTGKRGVLVAGIVLALVLACGVVAYRTLSPANTVTDATGTQLSSRAASGATNTHDDGTGADDDTAGASEAPQLADYDATVYTVLGEPTMLSQIANGKPLVINFWATWCPYCVQEMDDYLQLYRTYGDRVEFAFIDCNNGRGETVEKASAWLDDKGYGDFPDYYDTDSAAMNSFGAWSLPTTIVVSADGEIVHAAAGAIRLADMDALLSSLVG